MLHAGFRLLGLGPIAMIVTGQRDLPDARDRIPEDDAQRADRDLFIAQATAAAGKAFFAPDGIMYFSIPGSALHQPFDV